MSRYLAVGVLVTWLAAAAGADRTKIGRAIKKEPAYRGTPQYCLLVVGPETKTRVWLVFDGKTLYVDRNANGGLTDPGEAVTPRASSVQEAVEALRGTPPPLFFDAGPLPGHLGQVERSLKVEVAPRGCVVGVEVPEKYLLTRRGVPFAGQPAQAPVLFLDRPLGLELAYIRHLKAGRTEQAFYRESGDNWLSLRLVTTDEERGAIPLLANYENLDRTRHIMPATWHPVAEIEFPGKAEDGTPLRSRVRLDQRFAGQFIGQVEVPEGAAEGHARVTVSFPALAEGSVRPATFELPVVDAAGK